MSDPAPAIAVIVPAYGVAHLLHEALDSLIAQTLRNWEAVVIDDGAPDDVSAAVAPYLADRRIRFLKTANYGVSAARNRAIAASTAPVITLLDGDDRLRAGHLAAMVDAMATDPDAVIVTCDAIIFGEGPRNGLRISDAFHQEPRGTLIRVLDRSFNIYIGSAFRRAAFDRIGGFDEAMRTCEDFDLWLRLMIDGGHSHYVDEILGDYRHRPGSASVNRGGMLAGEVRAYAKAEAALGDRPERETAARMRAKVARQLAFEQAIDQIIDGDRTAGLRQLRAARPEDQSPLLHGLIGLWTILPFLARPMLARRRQRHENIHR